MQSLKFNRLSSGRRMINSVACPITPDESYCDDCNKVAAPRSPLFLKELVVAPRDEYSQRWLKKLLGTKPKWYESRVESYGYPLVMLFKESYEELNRSAEKGCLCCQYFVQTVQEYGSVVTHRGALSLVRHSEGELWFLGNHSMAFSGDLGHFPDKRTKSESPGYRNRSSGFLCLYEEAQLLARYNLCVEGLDCTRDATIVHRQVPLRAADRSCIEYISNRLADCYQNHPACKEKRRYVPSRLLDLSKFDCSQGGAVRLIRTQGYLFKNYRYCALSHCWGKSPPSVIRTTSANIDAHLERIDLEKLPQNFKDAIFVTKHLGVQYLWVDSFCIVQDDVRDWAKESAVMTNVYSSAAFTIAASRASNPQDGFLRSPRDKNFTKQSIELGGQSGIRKCDKILLQLYQRYPDSFLGRNEVDDYHPLDRVLWKHIRQPLGTRGWTLQERLLSTRTVFFDPTMIIWECRTARYLEGWTKSFEQMEITDFSREYSLERLSWPDFSDPRNAIWRPHSWWYRVLEEYRCRHLTVPTDALPAISGIARRFAEGTRDQYFAGIWFGDFLVGLTWRLDSSNMIQATPPDPSKAEKSKTIEKCFAPSWSWASVLEGRELVSAENREFRATSVWGDIFRRRAMGSKPGSLEFFKRRHAKIIELGVTPHTASLMGQVRATRLVVRGLVRGIVAKLRQLQSGSEYHSHRFFNFEMDELVPKAHNQHNHVCLDNPYWLAAQCNSSQFPCKELSFICLFLLSTSGLHCLLLEYVAREADGLPVYKRVGVLNNETMFDDFQHGWTIKRLRIV